jgi:hypothetical protein
VKKVIGFCKAGVFAVVENVALGEEEIWLLIAVGSERKGAAKRCQTCVALKGKRNSIVEPA